MLVPMLRLLVATHRCVCTKCYKSKSNLTCSLILPQHSERWQHSSWQSARQIAPVVLAGTYTLCPSSLITASCVSTLQLIIAPYQLWCSTHILPSNLTVCMRATGCIHGYLPGLHCTGPGSSWCARLGCSSWCLCWSPGWHSSGSGTGTKQQQWWQLRGPCTSCWWI